MCLVLRTKKTFFFLPLPDPEEFLNILFHHILRVEPLLKIRWIFFLCWTLLFVEADEERASAAFQIGSSFEIAPLSCDLYF